MGLLLKGAGDLVTKDVEKTEMLNTFFVLFFTGKTGLQDIQVL